MYREFLKPSVRERRANGGLLSYYLAANGLRGKRRIRPKPGGNGTFGNRQHCRVAGVIANVALPVGLDIFRPPLRTLAGNSRRPKLWIQTDLIGPTCVMLSSGVGLLGVTVSNFEREMVAADTELALPIH